MKISVTKTLTPKTKPSGNLAFGKHFTDHLFLLNYNPRHSWHNPRIVPYENFAMDPAACVFHYAQALFEGLKAFRQKDSKISVFRPQFNARRLNIGAERLCMPSLPENLFIEGITELIRTDRDWVPADSNSSLYIRPTLVGTEAFLGVRPSEEYLFYVILSPVSNYYAQNSRAVKIWVETEQIRAAPGGLGSVKAAANYAASLQAAARVKPQGYDQVLWLDALHKKEVEEVGTMNVFFVFKNEIVTPALNGSILAGGIRECTLELLRSWGHKVSERKISMDELAEIYSRGEWTEMFGTGTAAVICPVGSVTWGKQEFQFPSQENSVSQKLLKELTGIQRGEIRDSRGWMHPIDPSN